MAERFDAQAPSFDELSAAEQWLSVLKVSLPICEENLSPSRRKVVIPRIDTSIRMLDAYLADPSSTSPALEQFCPACLRRTRFGYRGSRGQDLAFLDDEYDRDLAEVESRRRQDGVIDADPHHGLLDEHGSARCH